MNIKGAIQTVQCIANISLHRSWQRIPEILQASHKSLLYSMVIAIRIAAGFGAISGLVAGKMFSKWMDIFLATTLATSVTGFFFPFKGLTPGIVVGILSVIALAAAIFALRFRRLAGSWRTVFLVTTFLSLYLNVFVLVVQLFQKMPTLKEIAPTQTEPVFAVTHLLILVAFIAMGWMAFKRFRNEALIR